MTDHHEAVAQTLRRYGIDETLANELLCRLDEKYVTLWVHSSGRHAVRTVDLAGASSRKGRKDRDKLLSLTDTAAKLARGIENLVNGDVHAAMRAAQISEKLSPHSAKDAAEAIRRLERAIRAVVEDMGDPPTKRRGNRETETNESALRMRQYLRSVGVTDDAKCAGVISAILAETGYGSASVDALKKFFGRQK